MCAPPWGMRPLRLCEPESGPCGCPARAPGPAAARRARPPPGTPFPVAVLLKPLPPPARPHPRPFCRARRGGGPQGPPLRRATGF
jgi:hypothetical protein